MRRFAVGSLSDILDMALVSPSVGDVLLFQSGQWQNKSLADAGISAVGHNHDNVYVAKTAFDPNTILTANIDNTPVAVSVAEQRLVGRVTGGSIAALTAGEVRTLLNVEDGATADMTANEILTALIGVDGSGSLLDGDLLDGQHGSYYSDIPARLGYTPVNKAGDTMTGLLYFSSTAPGWCVSETDQGTDLKNWQFFAYNQTLYFQSHKDDWTPAAILATLDRSGNWDVSGYLLSNTGIRSKIPSSPWETSGTWIGVSGYGQLYSPGSFRVGVYSNGYRNSSGQWTSFSINGNTGASGIDLDPAGFIYVRCEANKPTGDTMDVDRVAFFSPTTGLNIDLGLKVTGTVAAKDRVAVGGENFWTGRGVVVQGSTVCTGNTTTIGYLSGVTVGNDVTTSHYQYYSSPSVASGANTLQYLVHFGATANTFGQTVTYQYGFHVANTLTGAVNNYGFYGGIPSGTGRYNCYMGGTAYNYFSGNTGIGVLPDANNILKISGAIGITGAPTITGATDYAHLYTADIAAGNRAVHSRTENGAVIKLYQQSLIASPSADVASLKTAVDAIRTLLINNGLMASS